MKRHTQSGTSGLKMKGTRMERKKKIVILNHVSDKKKYDRQAIFKKIGDCD